jgi:hypothetical protein
MTEYAGLLGRACPAAVYEYADAEGSEADAQGKKFVINSQVRLPLSLVIHADPIELYSCTPLHIMF